MRDKLIEQAKRANETKDMYKRLERYSTLLKTPELTHFLSQKEIGDIYYNRSLNRMELCGDYFSNAEYNEAMQEMRLAGSDVINAQLRYHKAIDKDACKQRMAEYCNTRVHIRNVREGLVASSMKEFIKVSGLMITISKESTSSHVIPSLDNSPMEESHQSDNEIMPLSEFLSPPPKQIKLGFFDLSNYSLTTPHRDVHIVSPSSDGGQSGFHSPSLFSKTAILKRKLEKSALREEERKKCRAGEGLPQLLS